MHRDLGDFLFAIGLARGRYSDPLDLGRHHGQVYSQNGEDGIIAEIFRRVGVNDGFFVEIGVGDGLENNTRFLLERGWRGVWIDAEFGAAADAFGGFLSCGELRLVNARVTAENVNTLLDSVDVPENFDFLSLDIDHNTTHVWRAVERRSRVACIEYNASIPPSVAVEIPYDPDAGWDGSNWFGGSLKLLEQIGRSKSLHLVGCELHGNNAFFVGAAEAIGRFREPFTAEAHWEPPRYKLVGHIGHPPPRQGRHWVPPLPADFDAARYVELNPDVQGTDAARHWLQYGYRERRRWK